MITRRLGTRCDAQGGDSNIFCPEHNKVNWRLKEGRAARKGIEGSRGRADAYLVSIHDRTSECLLRRGR
jgi:hypothetical protein